MAKAVKSTITTKQIPLREARQLVVDAYGSGGLAEKLLLQWLGDGRVRWSCKLLEGGTAPKAAVQGSVFTRLPAGVYSEGSAAFWRDGPKVDWDENSARELFVADGTAVYGVTVPRGDVVAQLPEDPSEHEKVDGFRASAVWITAEVRGMKAAGEILPGIRITAFARELERRMKKAAAADRSLRWITWRAIKNMLPKLGLWPPSLIK